MDDYTAFFILLVIVLFMILILNLRISLMDTRINVCKKKIAKQAEIIKKLTETLNEQIKLNENNSKSIMKAAEGMTIISGILNDANNIGKEDSINGEE